MKLSRVLLRSFATTRPTAFLKPKTNPVKLALAAFGVTVSTWFSTQKIFNEELQIIETPDDLAEGEIREVLVGPKP